jgi:hypothetical protein
VEGGEGHELWVPAWMTRPAAEELRLFDSPRLGVVALVALVEIPDLLTYPQAVGPDQLERLGCAVVA